MIRTQRVLQLISTNVADQPQPIVARLTSQYGEASIAIARTNKLLKLVPQIFDRIPVVDANHIQVARSLAGISSMLNATLARTYHVSDGQRAPDEVDLGVKIR